MQGQCAFSNIYDDNSNKTKQILPLTKKQIFLVSA